MSFNNSLTYFDNSKHIEKLKKVTCSAPFNSFHIYPDGNVANCCFYWMPTFLGNITKKTLREILADKLSMEAKLSVTNGSYSFCNTEICPSLVDHLSSGRIPIPLLPIEQASTINQKQIILFLDFDLSCNLYCGSCRNERILHTLEDAPADIKLIHQRLMTEVSELLKDGYEITLQVTSSGDPFASPFYWQFLQNIKEHEKFKVRLTTNGTLMTRARFELPYSQKIDHIEVSVDAFTEATYKKVRRGGNFQALLQNLKNLDEMTANGELKNLRAWKVNFVVQKDNFREIPQFIHWALQFKKLTNISLLFFNIATYTTSQIKEYPP